MDLDVVTISGGLGSSALAAAVVRSGRSVLVLEREKEFKDRVRGENMLPWGVAAARHLAGEAGPDLSIQLNYGRVGSARMREGIRRRCVNIRGCRVNPFGKGA